MELLLQNGRLKFPINCLQEDLNLFGGINVWKQKIIFTDPKGLTHLDEANMEKIKFSKKIKEIEQKILKQYPTENIELYSFIVSETNKSNVPIIEIRNNPEQNGVFFFDDSNYINSILNAVGI